MKNICNNVDINSLIINGELPISKQINEEMGESDLIKK